MHNLVYIRRGEGCEDCRRSGRLVLLRPLHGGPALHVHESPRELAVRHARVPLRGVHLRGDAVGDARVDLGGELFLGDGLAATSLATENLGGALREEPGALGLAVITGFSSE